MKFRPLHDRVLIEVLDSSEKTAGGIIIPDTAQEKPQEKQLRTAQGAPQAPRPEPPKALPKPSASQAACMLLPSGFYGSTSPFCFANAFRLGWRQLRPRKAPRGAAYRLKHASSGWSFRLASSKPGWLHCACCCAITHPTGWHRQALLHEYTN